MFVDESKEGLGFSLKTDEHKMTTPWLTMVDDQNGKVIITQNENGGKKVRSQTLTIEYCDIQMIWAMLGEWLAQDGGVPKRYVQFPIDEDC
jgi:hypothetical protein